MAKQLTGEQVLEMQSKGLNINEIQTLATQKGYEMPDNRNFTEKLAPALDMVFGGGKVGEAIGTQIAKARATPEERQFVAPGPSAGEVAGSALQSAALFTPVGKLAGGITAGARSLGMKTGVSALGKIGAGAVAGGAFDVAQEMQGKDSGGIGTAIGAAIPAIGVGINVAGRVAQKVAPKLLSYTSDVPEKAFESMLQRREPVVSAIKAGATPETALKSTQGTVRDLRRTLTNDWQEGTKAIQQEFTNKRLGLSDKSASSLLKLADEFGFEDRLPQNIKSASVNEWMDTLKAINELPKLMLTMSPKGAKVRAMQSALKEQVTKSFGGETGSVAQLYKNYSAKKGVFDAANDIVNAYSTGKPIRQSTALNRLQTLFNENKPAYLEAILDLEKATGRDILSEITASKFANKLPTMGTSVSATSGLMAPAGPLDKVIKLMILPLSSPRSAGFIARTLGKVKSPNMPKGISPGDRVFPTLQKGASNINKTMAGKGGLSVQDVSKIKYDPRSFKTAEVKVNSKGQAFVEDKVSLKDLVTSEDGISTAKFNLSQGLKSKTNEPLSILIDKDTGEKYLLNGYHRFVDAQNTKIDKLDARLFFGKLNNDIISVGPKTEFLTKSQLAEWEKAHSATPAVKSASPLHTEALKYKTAEVPSYAMSHRPSKTGAIASDISKNGEVIPKDVYEHPEWYANMKDKTYKESFAVLKKIRGNPEAEITIYRSSPKNVLNEGDWVTLSKTYANEEGLKESVKTYSYKVKAKDIQFAGDDINEFGYYPQK